MLLKRLRAISVSWAVSTGTILARVRQIDASNPQMLKLTSEASHTFAVLARAQLDRSNRAEALRLVADGQQFEHDLELLRLHTGRKVTSLETSSDASAFGGSPSPVTIMVSSVKVIDKSCATRSVK